MCCPGELVTRGWHMRPGGLEEFVDSTKSGRLSLETIAGTEWVLHNWSWNEPAPPSPEVTLAYQDGQVVGSAGCNRYFATATPGEAPGDASFGPVGATRMACPEAAMQVEDRFLQQLQATVKYGFVLGQLALTYKTGDVVATMLFAPGETSPVEP
jgi:heat shock protein HslJ